MTFAKFLRFREKIGAFAKKNSQIANLEIPIRENKTAKMPKLNSKLVFAKQNGEKWNFFAPIRAHEKKHGFREIKLDFVKN